MAVSDALKNIFSSLVSKGVFFGRTGGRKQALEGNISDLKSLFTTEELRQELANAGFTVISIDIMSEDAPIGERSRGKRLSYAFYAEKP